MGKFRFLRAAVLSLVLILPQVASSAGLDAPGVHIGGDASNNTSKATGATGSRTLGAISADVVNVKMPYGGTAGATGNAKSLAQCTIAAASNALTCPAASFTAADVGKNYYLQGSAASNLPQLGTITGFTSATQVTLSLTSAVATPQWGIYDPPNAVVTINTAGTGYTNGTQTLTITGGTCTTQPQVSATVAGNVVTAVLSMVTPGVCSIAPASGNATTGGGGTGATFNTNVYQAGGRFIYGTDDTAAVTAAAAQAVASGTTLYFPAGSYWMASQTTSIPLNNVAVRGQGAVGYSWPYTTSGSLLLVGNKSTSVFSGMQGVDFDGVGFFYPEQDNSQTTPVTFPATFESAAFVNDTFRNVRVVNAYNLLTVDNVSGSGLGRVKLENVQAYCVNICFNFLNGMADVLTIGETNYFGPGAADNLAPYGPANMGRYTATSGEFIHVDVGSASYKLADGIMLTGFVVQGMRYGVRLVSGTIDVSNWANVNWDGVQTPLSVEGTSAIISTSISGGEVYGTDIYDLSQNACAYNWNSTAASEISFSGVRVTHALGSILCDATNGIASLTWSGMKLSNWGLSTTSAAYYAILIPLSNTGDHTISGSYFNCNKQTNSTSGLLFTQGGGQVNVTGNTFRTCSFPVVIQGTGTQATFDGNSSTGTIGAGSVDDLTGSNYILKYGINSWDKAPVYRTVGPATTCGTTPAIGGNSNWQTGTVTLGTGTPTACTVPFNQTLPSAPRCTVSGNTVAAGAVTVAASTTGLVFTQAVGTSSDVLTWNCSF